MIPTPHQRAEPWEATAYFSAGSYGYGHLARLVVTADGAAVGRFPQSAGFMMLRSQRYAKGPVSAFVHQEDDAATSTTRLDPRTVAFESPAADLAIAAQVPGCQYRMDEAADGSGNHTLWLFETAGHAGSWASVEYVPGRPDFSVRQHGPRRLWDEVADAYLRWVQAGRPERGRFGITVTPDRQYVWLDSPDGPHTWELPQ